MILRAVDDRVHVGAVPWSLAAVAPVSIPWLAPVPGMTDHQHFRATALVATVVYTLMYQLRTVASRKVCVVGT